MKKIILIFFKVIIVGILNSCVNSNESIKGLRGFSESGNEHAFSINSESTDYIYNTNTFIYLNNNDCSKKQLFYLNDNKFWVKLIKPSSEDFILFDLKTNLNETKKVEINYSGKIKSFDCILENVITTKENLKVYIYRLKKWDRISIDLNYIELDVKVFVTKENGVIGSYITDMDSLGNEIMISPAGEILKKYIDYSKIHTAVIE